MTSFITSLRPLLRGAKLFPLASTGGRDTHATAAGQISMELWNGNGLSQSIGSDNWSDFLCVTSSF
jgi:hypothetical protein